MTDFLPTNLDYNEIYRIKENLDISEEFIGKANREKYCFSGE